jgi:hypothetical protein
MRLTSIMGTPAMDGSRDFHLKGKFLAPNRGRHRHSDNSSRELLAVHLLLNGLHEFRIAGGRSDGIQSNVG